TYVGKRFSVAGGTIEFVGSPGVNPDLNIVARHVVRTPDRPLTIRILVTGTLESPKIRLESDAQPPLDESVLLSYLIFGRPFSDLTRSTADGRPGLASTVREGVLGYAASELEALLVAETGLVDYLEITGGSAVEPGYARESAAGLGTRVEAGWYLAPDVFVTVGQRFGGGARADIPDVRLDWRITRNLSLQFVSEERLERFQSTSQSTNPERAFGLFFFHEWSY
ncbi:MAG: translocation/assembly module TamB domain-containing protein, partial [Gemmatimonadota bacterium]